MAYTNFNYQGTDVTPTNLAAMEYLHLDVWTAANPSATTLQVTPINAGTGAAEILVTVPYIQNAWTSIVLPKSAFTGMTWDNVIQIKFAANGPGSTVPVDIYLDNIYFSTCGDSVTPVQTPTTNATDPTCAAANVFSIYGDYYATNIATNYNPSWGQSGTVNTTFNPGTGNLVMAYTNFNYQGTDVTPTNLAAMEYLHLDVWTAANPSATTLQVTPINAGTGAAEILVTVPYIQNAWTSIVLPKSAFTGMTWDNVIQIKFAANGPGSTVPVDIYLDNIYFSTCGDSVTPVQTPTTNATDPTCAAANVFSIYGDYYATNIATNYNPSWGQSGTVNTTFNPGTGNLVMAYTNFNYQGTDVTPTNLAAMEYLHLDVWTAANPSATTLQVTPINAGAGPAEILVTVPYIQNAWTSIVLPKSAFTGMTWDNVIQIKFAANGSGSAVPVDIYLDNIYFSTCVSGIEDLSSQAVSVYPNPSNGTLAVVSNSSAILNNITNIMGETVIALKGNESSINIESLRAGIYFLNFTVKGENQTIRIIRN